MQVVSRTGDHLIFLLLTPFPFLSAIVQFAGIAGLISEVRWAVEI
jgi:hypothetical protein